MKYKILKIDTSLFLLLLFDRSTNVDFLNLPKDLKFENLRYNKFSYLIEILVSSETFDPVEPGSPYPELVIQCKLKN